MKIGILTFHDGINHGAFLQTYSLYHTIIKMGYTPEIINYKNFKHWKTEYHCFLWVRNPKVLLKNTLKILKFKYCQKKMKQTKFSFHLECLPEYDKVIIGSDEVWNYKVNHADSIYFGIGLKAKQKIAYAASFGSVSIDDILPELYKKSLSHFEFLSVRDQNSLNIINNNLKGKACEKVLDPTFLYDFPQYSNINSNYILVYTTGIDKELQNEIRSFAKKQNKTLIAIGYNIRWCDKNYIALSPFEWISFFQNADMVITTMFHGTVFSIKCKRNFCTILEPYRVNKIKNMLEEFCLADRIYSEKNKFDIIFSKEIDYVSVDNIIDVQRNHSKKYLEKVLDE